jgi:MoxR-like ATPase
VSAPASPPDVRATGSHDPARARAHLVYEAGAEIRAQVARRIVGLEDVVEQVLISILTRNHALLEGVPGLAKTLLLSTMAELLDLSFSRIQFTPDLMPSDVTGSEFLVQDADTGQREFRFAPGPIFANVVLADEINRAPPKTQAALMEAMEERQVTSLGVCRKLDLPFFVLATQNPIEQEGTYPLPAAQLDRFLFKIRLDYPSWESEERIVRRTTVADDAPLGQVVTREEFLGILDAVERTEVRREVIRYAVDIVTASRPQGGASPASIREYVEWGAGPRAAQALIHGAKARACLRGRSVPDFDDVRALAPAVLRHRMVLSYAAQADDVNSEEITRRLLSHVPYPGREERRIRKSWLRRLVDALSRPPARARRA